MNKETQKEILSRQSKGELISLVIKLQEENKQLHKRIDELERAVNRQAAPFRVKEKKKSKNPKPPGNKPGHKGHYRTIDKSQIQETINVPLYHCPHCKGEVDRITNNEQIIEEIPVIKKQVYRVVTQNGICSSCGVVQTTHPLQTSTATGAAKVQIGPRAKAMCMSLQHEYGMSKRKISQVFKNVFDINISPGGIVYATHKAASKAKPAYEHISEQLKNSTVIHSDETSWYVGKPNYWLWVFTNNNATVYDISSSRGRDVITKMVNHNYSGTLVSDCLVVYDNINSSQHKCYSHHLEAISDALEKSTKQQQGYLNQLRLMLKTAIAVKKVKPDKPPDEYKRLCEKLEHQADQLLEKQRADELEEKVANRLRKQRDHLYTFLYKDEVDATNNIAERQLRPAVISRKISCGNKTEHGAWSWKILASLAATAKQRDESFVEQMKEILIIHNAR